MQATVPSSWLFDLRNRLLGSAKFRSKAEKLPLFQTIARRRAQELFAMAGGFIHSQVLASCVRLDLFDYLREGARSVEAIASYANLPAERAAHLLRAAAALRLLEVRRDGRYGLGVLGAAMVDNPSITSLIEHHETLYKDLCDPVTLFRGGATAREMEGLWPYATSGEPERLESTAVRSYTELMATSQSMVAEQVLNAYSFRPHGKLLDIGGGSGAFVSAVHERWPHLDLTVADLPGVAELARDTLEARGLREVIEVVGVDATRDELPQDFDVVSLVRILHDHNDDLVAAFLRAARRSLTPDGTLLVAEPLADAPGAGPLIDAYFNVYLLAMGSGRPRRFDELSQHLEEAGFGHIRRLKTDIPLITSVIVARPDNSGVTND